MSTATTATLTEWLLARIAEDEAKWEVGVGIRARDCPYMAAQMLAECEAHRRIVGTYERFGGTDQPMAVAAPLQTVACALAAVYSDHPEYRSEWAP
jgi:hypothetical protein